MSIIWFLFLFFMYRNGINVSDIAFLLVGIFYIGDCILISRKKE